MRRLLIIILSLFLCSTGASWAALNAVAVWEVRTTGSDTQCAGYFDPSLGGTDYSQQNSAQLADTDLTFTNGSTALTSVSQGGFTSAMKGNAILAPDGHHYELKTFNSATSFTLDRAYAGTTATGATGYIGGACASPGEALHDAVGGNIVWVQAGTYTISTTTANVSGGVLSLPGAANNEFMLIGYNSVRGDISPGGLTRPILSASGISSVTMINIASSSSTALIENIEVQCNSLTSITGINVGSNDASIALYDKVDNPTGAGITEGQVSNLFYCEVSGGGSTNAGIAMVGGLAAYCYVHGGADLGFQMTGASTATVLNCLSCNNTGASSHGFWADGYGDSILNCVAYNNGGDGVLVQSQSFTNQAFIQNTVCVDNGAWGYQISSAFGASGPQFFNDAAYNNTSGNLSPTFTNTPVGFITLSVDPFVSESGGNFSPNTTAGGGAALRAAGFPTTFTGLSSTSDFADIGLVQHQDSGGSTSVFPYSGQLNRARN